MTDEQEQIVDREKTSEEEIPKPDHYLSPILMSLLNKVRKRVKEKDFDWVAIVDGREGSGMSSMANQVAMFL